jgi:hypothetical protein
MINIFNAQYALQHRFSILFIIVLFCVSFISDLILNDLTRHPLNKTHNSSIIKSLETYFSDKSIIISGIYAGLTVVISYLLLIMLNLISPLREAVYSKLNNKTLYKLLTELCIAFIFGYIIDVVIYKARIFGSSLDNYYFVAGAGAWGAAAFIFAIIITYVLLRFVKYLF